MPPSRPETRVRGRPRPLSSHSAPHQAKETSTLHRIRGPHEAVPAFCARHSGVTNGVEPAGTHPGPTRQDTRPPPPSPPRAMTPPATQATAARAGRSRPAVQQREHHRGGPGLVAGRRDQRPRPAPVLVPDDGQDSGPHQGHPTSRSEVEQRPHSHLQMLVLGDRSPRLGGENRTAWCTLLKSQLRKLVTGPLSYLRSPPDRFAERAMYSASACSTDEAILVRRRGAPVLTQSVFVSFISRRAMEPSRRRSL